MGIDHKNIMRTNCRKADCDCDDFEKPPFEEHPQLGRKCMNCDHVPADHTRSEGNSPPSVVTASTILLKRKPEEVPEAHCSKTIRLTDVPKTVQDASGVAALGAPALNTISMKGRSSASSVAKSGQKRRDEKKLELLRSMPTPSFTAKVMKAITSTPCQITDVWEDVIEQTAAHYSKIGLGNIPEYQTVGEIMWNQYSCIGVAFPEGVKKPTHVHPWSYFIKRLGIYNRDYRHRSKKEDKSSLPEGSACLQDLRNLTEVALERKTRTNPIEQDFSDIPDLVNEMVNLYSAVPRDDNKLLQLLDQTYSKRSVSILGGVRPSVIIGRDFPMLAENKFFFAEARHLYSQEQITHMHQNLTAFFHAVKGASRELSVPEAFKTFFREMNSLKDPFITFNETEEEFLAYTVRDGRSPPHLQAVLLEKTQVQLHMGSAEFDVVESIPEGLLLLVLSTHLFEKNYPTKLGIAFKVLEAFALGIEAKELGASRVRFYQRMLETLPTYEETSDSEHYTFDQQQED